MSNSTPLHLAGNALDPVHFTSRVAESGRDEDRPNEHTHPEDNQDGRRDRRHRSKSGSQGSTHEILDVVTLSENAQKWLAGKDASVDDAQTRSEIYSFYSSLPRTLPSVDTANYPEGSRMLSRYDLLSIAAQQSANKAPEPGFMDDVVPMHDPLRPDFDNLIDRLQDRFPPVNMAQHLRLEMLALGLLRLKKVVRNQFIMVEGCGNRGERGASARSTAAENDSIHTIENALAAVRKSAYFKLGDDEQDVLSRRVAMRAALDAGNDAPVSRLADKHFVRNVFSNEAALDDQQRVDMIKILSSFLGQAEPEACSLVSEDTDYGAEDVNALHSIEKSLAEDVYQNMNEIIRQNRHAAWGQFSFA